MRTRSLNKHFLLLIAFVIIAALGIRSCHLDADPPSWYIPGDQGFHVDEGYKTFAAKNLLVFGNSHWNPEDEYRGWLKLSPVTQYSYYAAFKTLGLELTSARLASIGYYGLFLIIFTIIACKRWGPGIALLGAIMIALDPALYNFSRVALFESTLILFIYSGIFTLLYLDSHRPLIGALILGVTALVAGFYVKMSALLYLTPAIGILIASQIIGKTQLKRPHYVLIILAIIAFILILYFSRNAWIWRRVDLLNFIKTPQIALWNHMAILSPLLMSTAYLCIIHTIADRPSILRANLFRIALVASVVVTPIMLAMFSYNPPRYYVPIVPAAILLILDWVSRRDQTQAKPLTQLNLPQIAAIAVLSLMITMQFLRVINMCVILPLDMSEEPGISDKALSLWIFPLAAAAVLSAGLIFREQFTDARIRQSIKVCLCCYLMLSTFITGRALFFPTYQAMAVLNHLEENIEAGQSVAGGWAPFFAASATIPSMYMNMIYNHPDRIEIVKPDYFIFSNIPNDKLTLAELQKNSNIVLEPPIELGSYHQRDILLYPIRYPLK